jgi:hypothetical protein
MSAGAKTDQLYHAIPGVALGDEITPSSNYGAHVPAAVREALGISQTENTPLVFASNHKSKALAFGFGGDDQKILNATVESADCELVLLCDRDRVMSQKRSGSVWAFPADGFHELPHATRQFVSKKPVGFQNATKIMDITSAEDLMRAGLQVFSFREARHELPDIDTLLQPMSRLSTTQFIGELTRERRVVWENQAHNINPNPRLAREIGIALAPRRASVSRPSALRPKL